MTPEERTVGPPAAAPASSLLSQLQRLSEARGQAPEVEASLPNAAQPVFLPHHSGSQKPQDLPEVSVGDQSSRQQLPAAPLAAGTRAVIVTPFNPQVLAKLTGNKISPAGIPSLHLDALLIVYDQAQSLIMYVSHLTVVLGKTIAFCNEHNSYCKFCFPY